MDATASEAPPSRLEEAIAENTRQFSQAMSAIGNLTKLLEAQVAKRFYIEKTLPLSPNGQFTPQDIPLGSGGILLYPLGGADLANVTVETAGIRFGFPTGSTSPQFLPVAGTANGVAFKNTSGNLIAVRVIVMSSDYASAFAPFIGKQLAGGVSGNPLYTSTVLTGSNATIGNTGITSYGHLTGVVFNGGPIPAGATQYITGQNQEDIVAHIGVVFISAGATYSLKVGPAMIGNETAVAGIATEVNNTYTTINGNGGASQNFGTNPGKWADGYQIPAAVFPCNVLTYVLTNTSAASAAYYLLEHLTQ